MFLYPALTLGFLFVAMPLLVHLINMLRHRRQRWAAMDFLLASYRKQKKWIRLRQLLLLLSRLAVAALLIALLCGWTGGGQILGSIGGITTHHVVVLDDSYSMGDRSIGPNSRRNISSPDSSDVEIDATTAYGRSLQALQDLTRRLAASDGNHQLTVMRASRAAMVTRGGSESGDAAADLASQTIMSDAKLVNRVMATTASPIRTDLVPALDLATELVNTTPAEAKFLYIASDFRERDWGNPERLAESLRKLTGDVKIRMIDCAAQPANNLAITDLSPTQDVWVAGVPVVVSATVRNYGSTVAKDVPLTTRVIRYATDRQNADPTLALSGEIETQPTQVISSIPAGGEVTQSFQVFIPEEGTHAVEVSLPEDALPIDNSRTCTLPLSSSEKVLVIDGSVDDRGGYHIASVLNPGSQVETGAIPDRQPPSFLRSATLETFAPYRAVYLVDLPEIGENAAKALEEYVKRGGGLALFIGADTNVTNYNQTLYTPTRSLLPGVLGEAKSLELSPDTNTADLQFGEPSPLVAPLAVAGEAAFALVNIARSWTLEEEKRGTNLATDDEPTVDRPRIRNVLVRRDGEPFVTKHDVGEGSVVTVLSGLDGSWTNWSGDPTFVVFMLQTNALLWSGAAPDTQRYVDSSLVKRLPVDQYSDQVSYIPANDEPPRIPIELATTLVEPEAVADEPVYVVDVSPDEMVIDGDGSVTEVLHPGISEWALTRTDGSGQILPVASVIRVGEGELERADAAAIQQQMLPLQITFISSSAWSDDNQATGSSTLTLLLLGLLGLILAAEQLLAYWASYHASPGQAEPRGRTSLGASR
ncbi:MAG: BatA domain-containing protein [Rubripirellula sp.]